MLPERSTSRVTVGTLGTKLTVNMSQMGPVPPDPDVVLLPPCPEAMLPPVPEPGGPPPLPEDAPVPELPPPPESPVLMPAHPTAAASALQARRRRSERSRGPGRPQAMGGPPEQLMPPHNTKAGIVPSGV